MTESTTVSPITTLLAVPVTLSASVSQAIGESHASRLTNRLMVRIRSTVDTCLRFTEDRDEDPTATTDDFEISANTHEYFDVLEGSKISAIRASSASGNGVLKITICAKR
jgi:hypothetical protein